MSRWKAFAAHFGISVLLVLSLAAIFLMTWYPPEYARAVGGLELVGILAGVDVCLGPFLTLIVWNVKKPNLRFDMTVIVLVQILGLGYGLYTIFMARPVYMVFNVDRFDVVSVADIPAGELEKAKREEFRSLPLTGPKVIAAQLPTDIAERNQLLFSSVAGGADLPQLPRYYLPYAELATEAARKASPLDPLLQRDPQTRATLADYLESHHLDPAKVKFLPLRAKKHDQTVLVDGVTGAVLGIVNVDPWQN